MFGKILKSGCTLYAVFFFFLIAANAFSQDPVDRDPIEEDVIVYMERTECYGTCPAYSYKLFEDGTAEYNGKAYVEKVGRYKAEVSSEQLEEIGAIFYEYDFFEYKDRYTGHMSDLPTTYVYFSDEGKRKKITDYYGAPDSLKMLEKEIDNFFKSLDWKKEK